LLIAITPTISLIVVVRVVTDRLLSAMGGGKSGA
jgi:hypothetical protein